MNRAIAMAGGRVETEHDDGGAGGGVDEILRPVDSDGPDGLSGMAAAFAPELPDPDRVLGHAHARIQARVTSLGLLGARARFGVGAREGDADAAAASAERQTRGLSELGGRLEALRDGVQEDVAQAEGASAEADERVGRLTDITQHLESDIEAMKAALGPGMDLQEFVDGDTEVAVGERAMRDIAVNIEHSPFVDFVSDVDPEGAWKKMHISILPSATVLDLKLEVVRVFVRQFRLEVEIIGGPEQLLEACAHIGLALPNGTRLLNEVLVSKILPNRTLDACDLRLDLERLRHDMHNELEKQRAAAAELAGVKVAAKAAEKAISEVERYLTEDQAGVQLMMDPSWDREYGEGATNWKGPMDDSHDRGDAPYMCPKGWKRYSVRVPNFDDHWAGSNIVYHGTASKYTLPILSTGFMGVHGCHDGGGLVSYFSPSIVYASHGRYAKVWPRIKPDGSREYVQMVMQCRVKPDAIKTKAHETLSAQCTIDPDFEDYGGNDKLEWLVDATVDAVAAGADKAAAADGKRFVDKGKVLIYGLMIRVTDIHPKDIKIDDREIYAWSKTHW